MNIIKKLIDFYKYNRNREEVLDLIYRYRNIELKSFHILAGTIYILKDNKYRLMFFVKKQGWKKCLGVRRDYVEGLTGVVSKTYFYKSDCKFKDIESVDTDIVPEELIKQMFDELIKYKDDIHESLDIAIRDEFYK